MHRPKGEHQRYKFWKREPFRNCRTNSRHTRQLFTKASPYTISKYLQLGLWSALQTNSNNSTLKMGFTDTTIQRSSRDGVQTISNDSSTLPNELWLRYSTLYEDNYTFTLFSVGCIVGLYHNTK